MRTGTTTSRRPRKYRRASGPVSQRQGLMRHLGARLGHIEPGRVHIVLPSRPK